MNSSPPKRIDAVGAADRADPLGNFDQQRVTAIVADEIVDLLEAVEVDAENGDVAFPVFADRVRIGRRLAHDLALEA